MWRIVQWAGGLTVLGCIVACLIIAVQQSNGLTSVTVVAVDENAEPRDPGIPLIGDGDRLPDYRLVVKASGNRSIDLGTKPNESARNGLTWHLPQPIPTNEIASIRLEDEDAFFSDLIAEVQFADGPIDTEKFQFRFETTRSFAAGVRSFFRTPIGLAITAALMIAIVVILLASYIAAL